MSEGSLELKELKKISRYLMKIEHNTSIKESPTDKEYKKRKENALRCAYTFNNNDPSTYTIHNLVKYIIPYRYNIDLTPSELIMFITKKNEPKKPKENRDCRGPL